ncbi:MAG: hypothetical protein INQ03_17795 [Candidatus Heimdallarchaeota archaeon]|nr:hypothetical protein [Candidatus Heimdallarchaeota archaeon]
MLETKHKTIAITPNNMENAMRGNLENSSFSKNARKIKAGSVNEVKKARSNVE